MTGTDVDPWRRYGWVMWAPWMIFLVYPLLAAIGQDSAWQQALGVSATVAFGVVYATSIHARMADDLPRPGDTAAVRPLVVLVAVSLLATLAIGLGALSYTPFLVAFATFGLPRPWNWRFDAVVLLVALLGPLAGGEFRDWAPFLVILLAVSGGTVAGRIMADHGEEAARFNEELVVTSERERVARDVHDVLGHSLTVVSVKAELAARLLDVDPARARAELEDVQRLARQALAEVRATVGGLRAARLEDELGTAQSALTAAGIRAEVAEDPSVLDPRHRAVAGWVVREAVTNVVRHSAATRCEIGLRSDRLWVRDDGVGCEDLDAHRGNGLRGLRERVQGSGGRLDVRAAEGGGTLLEVTW